MIITGTAGCYSCHGGPYVELWLLGFALLTGVFLVLKSIAKDILGAHRRKRNRT